MSNSDYIDGIIDCAKFMIEKIYGEEALDYFLEQIEDIDIENKNTIFNKIEDFIETY